MIQLDRTPQGHAIEASQVATVGNGNPEVVNRSLVAISEQSH